MAVGINQFGAGGIGPGGFGPGGMSGGMGPIQESSSIEQFQREMGQQGFQEQGINEQALRDFFGGKVEANDPNLLDKLWESVKDTKAHYDQTVQRMNTKNDGELTDPTAQLQMMWDMNQMSLQTQLVTKIASEVSKAAQKLMSGQ